MTILPLTGGGDVFAQLRGHLTRPVILPLLADRDLTARGIEVDFCGNRARMAAGPAALALATGAALHPVSIHYEAADGTGWRHRVVITFHEPVADPATGTTRSRATAMTQAVRRRAGRRGPRAHRGLAHAAARVRRRPRDGGGPAVRIGIVCPYSFDVPGGVQFHVRDLAEHFLGQGHHVCVLAPADNDTPLPGYVESVRTRHARALQRVRGPAELRPGHRGPGGPLARARASSTSPPPRAGDAEHLGARPVGGGGPHRGDVPHVQRCARAPCRRPTPCCGPAWRRSPGGSPSRRTPAGP